MTKKTYVTKTPIHHDGVEYQVGEQIELDDKTQAPPLIAVGAVEAAPLKKAAAQ